MSFTEAQLPSSLNINLTTHYSGLSTPVGIYNCGDNRLFVLEQSQGDIEIIDTNGAYIGKFLDLTGVISTGSERGLLGLAFHPNYLSNGFFFVNYTNTAGNTVIAKYSVSGNPNIANAASAVILLTITQDFSNHNGGHLAFGPDGNLYIGMGDGGSGGDPNNRAQNPLSLLGKMLRINVTGVPTFTIPSTNPYFGQTDTLPAIWAMGARNPWKFSFDDLTGDMWIGDVGQNAWEEINMEPAGTPGGSNWGWRCYEGFNDYNINNCNGSTYYDFPVKEYSHGSPYNFCSITGGIVYRGAKYPGMQGHYFFTDYCAGGIYTLFANGLGGYTETLADPGPGFGNVAFGTDTNGNLYLCNASGTIYEIVDNCGPFSPTITTNGIGGLQAVAGTQYWWWNNGTIVNGANNQTFTPTASGTYYATVSNGTCTRQTNSVLWIVQSGIPGCTYSSALNFNAEADVDDGSCIFPLYGCIDPLANNYDGAANTDNGTCLYGVPGCLDPYACNYDSDVDYQDCTLCDYATCQGCTEPCAENYDPSASIDDGSCIACAQCPGDLNNDGIVGLADLLVFVANFGSLCSE